MNHGDQDVVGPTAARAGLLQPSKACGRCGQRSRLLDFQDSRAAAGSCGQKRAEQMNEGSHDDDLFEWNSYCAVTDEDIIRSLLDYLRAVTACPGDDRPRCPLDSRGGQRRDSPPAPSDRRAMKRGRTIENIAGTSVIAASQCVITSKPNSSAISAEKRSSDIQYQGSTPPTKVVAVKVTAIHPTNR